MKADISDAPERVIRKRHKSEIFYTCIGLAMSGIAALGAFQYSTHASRLDAQPEPTLNPIARNEQLTRTSDVPPRQAVESSWLRPSSEEPSPVDAARQTVFNEHNYIPRGADNVIALQVGSDPSPSREAPKKMKLTIVQQSPSMKDRACWPYRQGSLESRRCRASIGLMHRD
jgi:hypothetical protein